MNKWIEASSLILDRLKGWLIKKAIFKIFGKALGGVWGWLATTVIGNLFDKVIKPLWKTCSRKVYIFFKKKTFKKKAIKLEESKNESDFDNNFDDLP